MKKSLVAGAAAFAMAALPVAGVFAADRSIKEYAERIWGLKQIK